MFSLDSPVLCIDDTKTINILEEKFLKALGFRQVIACSSVDQGIALLKSSSFGLIICDVNMPGKTGLDFLTEIGTDSQLNKIPVVMLSIEKDIEVVNKCLQLGAVGYLLKPFTEDSLRKGLEAAFKTWNGKKA